MFSSDRPTSSEGPLRADHYAIYLSHAAEVHDEAAWDTSHVPPLWTMLWWLIAFLLALGLLAALIW